MTTSRGRRQRSREWILWSVPLAMVAIAGVLIASTQRQADYADWYHHWITAAVGACDRSGPDSQASIAAAETTADSDLCHHGGQPGRRSPSGNHCAGRSTLAQHRRGAMSNRRSSQRLSAILLLAAVLDRHPVERPGRSAASVRVIISIPWVLVFIQPDLGTSLVFGALLLTMLYWSGMPIEWLVLLLSPLVYGACSSGLWCPWGTG